jgi:uncharacterized repeat protein (TIGR03803 family)
MVKPLSLPTKGISICSMSDNGKFPSNGVRDAAGNLYGTIYQGGASNHGVVFKLVPGGNQKVLHNFTSSDGAGPFTGVIRDSAGNLYGATYAGPGG